MNNWRPRSSKGGLIGIFLTLLVLAGFCLLIYLGVSAAFETGEENTTPGANLGTLAFFLSAAATSLMASLLAYRTWGFYQLRYFLDRNSLRIELGGRQQNIPLANITQVFPGSSLPEKLTKGSSFPPETIENSPLETERVTSPSRPSYPGFSGTSLPNAAADSSVEEEDDFFKYKVVEEKPHKTREGGKGIFTETKEDYPAPEPGLEPGLTSEKSSHPFKSEEPGKINPTPSYKVKTKILTSWPGFYTNRGWLEPLGEVQFYSTQPIDRSVIIRTAKRAYAISPTDLKQFVIEYNLRRNLGAVEAVEEGIIGGKVLSHPLWKDRLAQGLILTGLALNLALFIYLLGRFGDLPPIMRLHYNKFGVVDRLESASSTLWLPFFGFLAGILNLALGAFIQNRDRLPALLLYGSIIIVQVMAWIAVLGIIATSGG